ncbi:MAG: alpha/beta hydrolase [Phycisphaerae bacterium]
MNLSQSSSNQAEGEIEKSPAERSGLMARGKKLVYRLIALYLFWCLLLFATQRWLIFSDHMSPEPTPAEKYDASTTVLTREIDGGRVIAWLIPGRGASAEKPAPLVVYCHGSAEIIDFQGHRIEGYRSMGVSVLMPEYRGYGRSDGQPSEQAIVDDAVYFHDLAIKRPDVDASRVLIHGRSLGGGIAAGLAARRKPKALILGSTFTSIRAMAHKYLAPGFIVCHPLYVDRVLKTLDIPVLIFHGTRDNIVPVAHGRTLRDIARNGTYIEYDCRHNDFPGDGNEERYWGDIEGFLKSHGILAGGRGG